jgi:hypothetical protein
VSDQICDVIASSAMTGPSSDSQDAGQDGAESDGAASRPRGNPLQRLFRSAGRRLRAVSDRIRGRSSEDPGPPSYGQANLAPHLNQARAERNQTRRSSRWATIAAGFSGAAAAIGGGSDLNYINDLSNTTETAKQAQDKYKRLKRAYEAAGGEPEAPDYSQPGRQEGTSAIADELPAYQQEETVEERRTSTEIRIRQNEAARGRGGHESGLGDDGHAL